MIWRGVDSWTRAGPARHARCGFVQSPLTFLKVPRSESGYARGDDRELPGGDRRVTSLASAVDAGVCRAGGSGMYAARCRRKPTADSTGGTPLSYPHGITSPMRAPATTVRWAVPDPVTGEVNVRVPQLPGWSQDHSAVTQRIRIALHARTARGIDVHLRVSVLPVTDESGHADTGSGGPDEQSMLASKGRLQRHTVCGFPAATWQYATRTPASIATLRAVSVTFGEARWLVVAKALVLDAGGENKRWATEVSEMLRDLQILEP